MSTSKTQLSEQAKKNLERNAELRNRDNKFLSIQPGAKIELLFDPERIEVAEREFDGKPVKRFQYTVKDTKTGQEKIWTVSKRVSEQLDAFLSEGHTLLKIQRVGLGRDTRYYVIPA